MHVCVEYGPIQTNYAMYAMYAKKKTSFVNIVRASNMHVCVEYGPIQTNYAMYLAITPVISTETIEC